MKLKVLVVDDEKPLKKFVVAVLEKFKPESDITAASNGDEAVSIIIESIDEPFDLVITDINMPGMFNGFDVIFQAKEMAERLGREIIVVAMSGEHVNYDKAIAEGADFFLAKPFSLVDDLMPIIKKCLLVK